MPWNERVCFGMGFLCVDFYGHRWVMSTSGSLSLSTKWRHGIRSKMNPANFWLVVVWERQWGVAERNAWANGIPFCCTYLRVSVTAFRNLSVSNVPNWQQFTNCFLVIGGFFFNLQHVECLKIIFFVWKLSSVITVLFQKNIIEFGIHLHLLILKVFQTYIRFIWYEIRMYVQMWTIEELHWGKRWTLTIYLGCDSLLKYYINLLIPRIPN